MGTWPTLAEIDRIADVSNTAASVWASVTASGTTNTKGSWTQLTASCPFDVSAIFVGIRSATASVTFLVDVGTGAAAAERVILPNMWVRNPANPVGLDQVYVPMHIPNGTRVSARCQSATASAVVTVGLYFCGVT